MAHENTVTKSNNLEDEDALTISDCRICSNIISSDERREPWNKILYETEEFLCVPTVGALTEGYVLTIPKYHALCGGDLDQGMLDQYWSFTKSVADVIESKFGDTIIFEHGPAKPNTKVGCGVDHAHMHIVPVNGEVRKSASRINPESIGWHRLDSIKNLSQLHDENQEYVLIKEDEPFVGTAPNIISQLFRRAIADIINEPEKFDWKSHPFENKVKNTVSCIEGFSSLDLE